MNQVPQHPQKILVAMSGGVDSSVAALLLKEQGHDVTGVTMKLWGGTSDVGCCSVSDVDDARRVADTIDIPHFVFNFGDEFQESVVDPYIESYQKGQTPNPCIECNRKIKFQRLSDRARALGFEKVATGHHAQILPYEDGQSRRLGRGADREKDQSYVLNMLTPADLEFLVFPIGHLTKAQIRDIATKHNLRIAQKPDSYEVCFIQKSDGRQKFLEERISPTPARVVNMAGEVLGEVPSLEMLTVGQRKGISLINSVNSGNSAKNAKNTSNKAKSTEIGPKNAPNVANNAVNGKIMENKQIKPSYIVSIEAPAHNNIAKKPHNNAGIEEIGNHPNNFTETSKIGTVKLGSIEDLLTKTQDMRDIQITQYTQSKDIQYNTQYKGESAIQGKAKNKALVEVEVQTSAHGKPTPATLIFSTQNNQASILNSPIGYINWKESQKKVASGQSLVFYKNNIVVGSATAS